MGSSGSRPRRSREYNSELLIFFKVGRGGEEGGVTLGRILRRLGTMGPLFMSTICWGRCRRRSLRTFSSRLGSLCTSMWSGIHLLGKILDLNCWRKLEFFYVFELFCWFFVVRDSRGFAFVQFATTEEANKAVNELNQAEFMGRTVAVEISKRRKARRPTPGRYLGQFKRRRRIG